MAQDGEGLRSLVCANPTGILIKGDIEDPMEGVLDAPVLPYRLGEPHALRWQGSQKIPRLDLDRVPHFTTCLDHPHAVPVGPRGLGAKPLNLRRDPIPTRFNAAMIPIDRFVIGVSDVSKPRGPGIVEKHRHRLSKRRVIVLQGQDIICPLLCHGLRHVFLTPHGINRDHRSSDVEQTEECGKGGNVIRLLLDFQVPQHSTVRTGPGTHQMESSRGGGRIKGMAQRFAVDGYDIAPRGHTESICPRDEALGQLLGGQA